MAKISIVSRKIHHLITTLFIDPTYLHHRMKWSQKVEELKLWPKNDPYGIWWTLTCCWIKRSNTLSLYEKRHSNYKEAVCLIPQTPPPPFFYKDNDAFEISLLNDVNRKFKKKKDCRKHWVHVRDLAERLTSLCAVIWCLIRNVHLHIQSYIYLLPN